MLDRILLYQCVLVFTLFCIVCTAFFVLFRLCIRFVTCFVCTATECQLNFSYNNNNNNNKLQFMLLHTRKYIKIEFATL
jgi:hypothetical protein